MEYAIIGIIIVVVLVTSMVISKKSKKNASDVVNEGVRHIEEKTEVQLVPSENELQELVIQMEILPAATIPDENKLVEISDSRVLTHVNNLIPGLAQVGNVVNNAVQAAQGNGEVLYRAIIPVGAKLTDSKAMGGAVRGIYHGADGIRGHANLVAVEAQKGTAVVANTAAAAMGVASMVVGQYYMTQINAELGEISDGISKIADFQDNEYRSRVFSLVAHVKKIADFQIEILENTELRLSKISQLDSLEEECTQLLGQANLALVGYTDKNNLDYDAYEKELTEVQNWYMYQKSLLDMINKISELRYTLHLGAVSREHCVALLPTYTNQVAETQKRLTGWHQTTTERLGIDISEVRRKRAGFDGVIHFLPGLFNDNLKFRTIEKTLQE
ncbi:MAG: hypothetical protein MSE70_08225 [Streptococcus sp.]|uniref:hypothetical protein n=1 Tax=Streptococcus sp. TaxID=1306 RepID=UPI002590ACBA|nr:hypothetical protein [Streptococcus sp.]MCI7517008.1 hypothetical protein [Streptococcus sp.]MDY5270302.1 hypothetical protein [Streptococcus sp.]